MTFLPEYADEFEAYFSAIKDQVAGQSGCNGVKLLRDINDNRIFFTYSSWDSEEDLNQYRQSEIFGMIWPKVKAWFDERPEAWSVAEIVG